MHRFIEYRNFGVARIALRSDGALWVLADGETAGVLRLRRAGRWIGAGRVRLCRGDRVRVEETELTAEAACALMQIDMASALGPPPESRIPGLEAPVPLRVPSEALDKARRNPSTGQIEQPGKEPR